MIKMISVEYMVVAFQYNYYRTNTCIANRNDDTIANIHHEHKTYCI